MLPMELLWFIATVATTTVPFFKCFHAVAAFPIQWRSESHLFGACMSVALLSKMDFFFLFSFFRFVGHNLEQQH